MKAFIKRILITSQAEYTLVSLQSQNITSQFYVLLFVSTGNVLIRGENLKLRQSNIVRLTSVDNPNCLKLNMHHHFIVALLSHHKDELSHGLRQYMATYVYFIMVPGNKRTEDFLSDVHMQF